MSNPSELWPPDLIYYIIENDDWSALEGRDKVTFDLSCAKYNIRPELVRPKKKMRSPLSRSTGRGRGSRTGRTSAR